MRSADVDIVIVGAGLAGASTAYHLARMTQARILVLEQESLPGMHSSGRNAAIVREHADDPDLQKLVSEGAAFLRRGELATFERRGLLVVGGGGDEIQLHFPRARGVGRWCPEDGTVDVAGLLRSYLAGQQIQCNTVVNGWSGTRTGLEVQTTRGPITCSLLVNAAGPWAGALGDLPLVPMNRHLFVTTLLEWVDPRWPCVWDGARGLYFRPESGGLLLCCCDEAPAAPGDYRENPLIVEQLAEKVGTLQPGLGELAIRSKWVGQRVFAPDRKFVIGVDPRDERVYHVAGLGGHGVTASYVVGYMAARLITGGSVEGSEAFAPGRFFAGSKPLAVIVEQDKLTCWSLRSYLAPAFRIALCGTFQEAGLCLGEPDLRLVLLGIPIADADRKAVEQLAERPDVRVVALVSHTDQAVPHNVAVVEKPFDLGRLTELLHMRGRSRDRRRFSPSPRPATRPPAFGPAHGGREPG